MKPSEFLKEKRTRMVEDWGDKDGTVELTEKVEELDKRFIDREEVNEIIDKHIGIVRKLIKKYPHLETNDGRDVISPILNQIKKELELE